MFNLKTRDLLTKTLNKLLMNHCIEIDNYMYVTWFIMNESRFYSMLLEDMFPWINMNRFDGLLFDRLSIKPYFLNMN